MLTWKPDWTNDYCHKCGKTTHMDLNATDGSLKCRVCGTVHTPKNEGKESCQSERRQQS
jgi:hypothetical protein